MTSTYDVNPNDLIEKTAQELKTLIKAPEWAGFVKTGVHKERPPTDPDWWYVRAAAVLRTVQRMGPIGVSKLRTKYGGKKNRGHKTEHFYKGSGAIIRHILQELEKAELIKQTQIGVHKGRIITPVGQSLLDKAASALPLTHVHKEKPIKESPAKPKAEPSKEAPVKVAPVKVAGEKPQAPKQQKALKKENEE